MIAAVVLVLCLWPMGRFVASDWKWNIESRRDGLAAGESPNVLLISIDTLRADHLGAYGDQKGLTPNLDRLARGGVVFRQTITSSPWTLPAVASLLTGLNPSRHGAGQIANRRDPLGRSALSEDVWTLASGLAERGYRTQAVVTNPYLALRYGFGQGFQSYENVTIASEAFLAFRKTTAARLLRWLCPSLIPGDRGGTVSRRAQRWLMQVDVPEPFFLWLHYIDPHPPYSAAGAPHNKTFRSDSLLARRSETSPAPMMMTSPDIARLRSGEIRLDEEEKQRVRALYEMEVAAVDRAIGSVLDTLDRAALAERTIVICVADHGEEFWEHGGVEHGQTVYEEVIRIPLIMRWPEGLPAGETVDAPARIIDVAPTILDLLGLPQPAGIDGESLMPILTGAESTPRIAVIQNMLFSEERIGLRTPTRKYVRWSLGKEEVYDLVRDPEERLDLAAIAEERIPLTELYARSVGKPEGAINGRGRVRVLDGATRAALETLGYL